MAYTVLQPKGDLLPRILTGLVAVPAVIFLIFQDPIFLNYLVCLQALDYLENGHG